jgi:hypothetical protein
VPPFETAPRTISGRPVFQTDIGADHEAWKLLLREVESLLGGKR